MHGDTGGLPDRSSGCPGESVAYPEVGLNYDLAPRISDWVFQQLIDTNPCAEKLPYLQPCEQLDRVAHKQSANNP